MATAAEILALVPWRYGDPPPEQERIAGFLEGHLAADEKVERAAPAFVESWEALAVMTPTRIVVGINRLLRVGVESFGLAPPTMMEDGVDSRIDIVLKEPGRRFHFRLVRDVEGVAFHEALRARFRPKGQSITFTPFDARYRT